MFDYFHVSPYYNKDSILKYGLLPSIPVIENHQIIWQEEFGTKRVVYLCPFTKRRSRDIKLIKDTIYCKIFVDSANRETSHLDDYFYNSVYDLVFRGEKFVVFGVKFDNRLRSININHDQSKKVSFRYNFWKNVDSRYCHYNKEIKITPSIIKPRNIKVIGEAYINSIFDIKLNVRFLY